MRADDGASDDAAAAARQRAQNVAADRAAESVHDLRQDRRHIHVVPLPSSAALLPSAAAAPAQPAAA